MTSNQEYRLTPTQEGMLYHALLAPESEAYQVQLTFLLSELDPSAFLASWERLALRHCVFRTRFAWKDCEYPKQVVASKVSLPWTHLNWREMSSDEADRQWDTLLRADRIRPFDLSSLPLMRFTLAQDPAGQHRFVWTFPHLLLDGWSLSVLTEELQGIYALNKRGQKISLPEPPRLSDYLQWLNSPRQGSGRRLLEVTIGRP